MFSRKSNKYQDLENIECSGSETQEDKSNVSIHVTSLNREHGNWEFFSEVKQRRDSILGKLTFYLKRFGNFCHFNSKKLFVVVLTILLAYWFVYFVDFEATATKFKYLRYSKACQASNIDYENTAISYGVNSGYVSPKIEFGKKLDEHRDYKNTGINLQLTSPATLPLQSKVLQSLAQNFPYNRDEPIPKQIWQLWKCKLDDPSFPEHFKNLSITWTETNPNYIHTVVTNAETFGIVEKLYANVPEVVHAYNIMPAPILQIDFFRYLILFAKGGVYSDIDTKALKPIDEWASNIDTNPNGLKHTGALFDEPSNPGLVLGLEADPDSDEWHKWYARRLQICQWTIQSKRGHPMLRELIARITEITLAREETNDLNPGANIMEWTGPGIFTDYVFDYSNGVLQASSDFRRRRFDTLIDNKFFTHMEQPIVIHDLMILPITCLSPDIGWMGAKESTDPMAYVKHMFSGSWKAVN